MATIPAFVLNPSVQHRELKLAESYAPSHGGLLPNDPFWRYVENRFDQALESGHLARFTHYHPVITPLLEANLKALTPAPAPAQPIVPLPPIAQMPAPPVTSFPVIPPGTPGTPTVPVVPPSEGQPQVPPTAVPEPPTALLFGLGIIVVAGLKIGRKLLK